MEKEWKSKRIAVIGLGSGGSAVADMLGKAGATNLTLVDPDMLTEDNLKRHVLGKIDVGKPKVDRMSMRVSGAIPIAEKFSAELFGPLLMHADPGGSHMYSRKPDLIASCVDSLACESLINAYSLENNVPVVYGGVHGDARTAEIVTVVPGETPCYECYEREGPLPEPGQEAYTDPNYDKTKMPHQEGLWCDVLMAAALQVQAVLGVLGIRERFPPLVLMSLRVPFKTESGSQKERCAICSEDFSGLQA